MHSHAHCTTPQHSITQCNVVAIVQLGRKSTEVTKQALQHSRTQNNVVMAAQFIYNGTTLFCSSTNGQEARKGCTTNIVDQCNTAWARGPAGACRKQGHLQRGLLAGAFHDKQLTNALKVVSARPNDVCVHVCVVCACKKAPQVRNTRLEDECFQAFPSQKYQMLCFQGQEGTSDVLV
eukprot:scaffold97771_cov27-Tisochrysis_lutea.AAC.2